MRYKVTVSYKGSAYSGFQRQNNATAIQNQIEAALFRVYNKEIAIHPASRTDKGVHAYAQVFHYDVDINIALENLATVINRQLAEDIRIHKIEIVDAQFHARYSVKAKEYLYRFSTATMIDVFSHDLLCHYGRDFELEACQELAEYFLGKHDFKAFMAAGSDKQNTIRTLYKIDFSRDGEIITMAIAGDGFLYKMIRIMMGMFFDYSEGKFSQEEIIDNFERGNRNFFKRTALAAGLYLKEIQY